MPGFPESAVESPGLSAVKLSDQCHAGFRSGDGGDDGSGAVPGSVIHDEDLDRSWVIRVQQVADRGGYDPLLVISGQQHAHRGEMRKFGQRGQTPLTTPVAERAECEKCHTHQREERHRHKKRPHRILE